ncbi:hypothetical protein [Paenibacillus sp. UMB4589-SE434]|uniref:hypothetical protein n=1 Tax=Paenibacillus sp. UMB4589-SE434 TaxID=3046314 RepID=UPI00254AAD3C|nr:hypothetical protein [Paenibacillus sp. UMB4589-SE434]MDK8182028.1 hypothetical protein [Paenibacillus sp. UMB4589-SE434]
MKMMWCWRCKCEMPMLDEGEYARIHKLYGDCMKATKELEHGLSLEQLSMDERFRPVVKEYEKITGVSGVHHNAIMHHQISLFGDLPILWQAIENAKRKVVC